MPEQELAKRYVATIWRSYAQNRSAELRDCLVEFYLDLGLVGRTVKHLARSLPQQVDPDELASAGAFGLLAAVERFDPSRGVKFETFSQQPIRGAMLDYLREVDHLSRTARAQANRLIEATERLRAKLGRPPGEEEVRRQLDVSPAALRQMSRSSREGVNLSLGHRRSARDEEEPAAAHVAAVAASGRDGEPDGLHAAMKRDVRAWVVRDLPRRHRLLVVLYYYEGMTMREIGLTLGMSESRVSQLHTTIIERLQERLRDREDELVAAVG
jgi:RNA polymerase sigma factor FliA